MTKRERAEILRAMHLLQQDGTGWNLGMDILAKLVGVETEASNNFQRGMRNVTIAHAIRQGQTDR